MKVRAFYLPRDIFDECRNEASLHFPLESGGTFMGYVHKGAVIIDGYIGPGPLAQRQRYSFTPDQNWQLEQIATYYEQSGRRSTYVGDWHSHPGASSGKLSGKDCRVLKRVMTTPEARCPAPVMTILWGGPDEWGAATWGGTLLRRPLWLGAVVEPVELEQLGDSSPLAARDLH